MERPAARWRCRAGPVPRSPRCDSPSVRGGTVLCPSNTFMATPLAVVAAGARSSSSTATARTSAPRSPTSRPRRGGTGRAPRSSCTSAGHIAFEIERIAALCRAEGIFLIEDCAHAHGARWHGRRAGTWGDAASGRSPRRRRSRPARAACSSRGDDDLIAFAPRVPRLRQARLRDRRPELPDERVHGAIGLVQVERLDEIVAWKNAAAREQLDRPHPARVELPDGMVSGLYKYIVFEPIDRLDRKGLRRALSPASWDTRSTCRTPTGSPRTTGASRSTTGP